MGESVMLSGGHLNEEFLRASPDGNLGKVGEVLHVDPQSCKDADYDSTSLHGAFTYGH